MQIEVESLKELEEGKTYAVQLREDASDEKIKAISESILQISEHYNIRFILFTADLTLIDAPAEVVNASH